MNTQATLIIGSIINKEDQTVRIGQFNETIELAPHFGDSSITDIINCATLDSGNYEIEIRLRKVD